ncbi:protein kinase, partial [Actinotalea ferrariae CF5-4]
GAHHGTVALPVGPLRAAPAPGDPAAGTSEGTDDDADPALRRWRRRVAVVLTLIALGAVSGLVGLWYATAGPGAYTTVPGGLVGADRAAAEEALATAGLGVSAVTEVFDAQAPVQTVVAVEPGEGGRILKEGDVELTVSKGPDLRVVPEGLVGATVEDATAALQAVGLVAVEGERTFDDVAPAGTVLTATAEPGTSLAVGSEVGLRVSDGPAPVTVLSVVGVEAGAARQQLEADGLVVEEATAFSEQYGAGVVMAQDPAPGTAGFRGDTVTITVSQGPPLVEVPNLVGQQFADARAALERLGFAVVREDVLGGFFGTVRSQDATPGSTLPKGSTITLAVV